MPSPRDSISHISSLFSGPDILSAHFFVVVLEPWKSVEVTLIIHIWLSHSFSAFFSQLYISALTTIQCKKTLLCPRLRAAQVCG